MVMGEIVWVTGENQAKGIPHSADYVRNDGWGGWIGGEVRGEASEEQRCKSARRPLRDCEAGGGGIGF